MTNKIPIQVFDTVAETFRPGFLYREGEQCIGVDYCSQGESRLYLAPGFIDSHAHIYPGATDLGIPADRIGLATGVHLIADAGSAGSSNFTGFRDYIVPACQVETRAFLNISRVGLVTKQPYYDRRNLDLTAAEECLRNDRSGLLLGIKVLSSGLVVEDAGLEPLRSAVRTADRVGCRMMVHLVEGPPSNEETMALLRPGDIITHIFHGMPNLEANQKANKGATMNPAYCNLGNVMWQPDGSPTPPLEAALARGVLLDVGHGAASLDQNVARAAIQAGVRRFSISTDAHIRNIDTVVHSLPHTMSKFLALGMTLAEIISSVTVIPARQLGLTDWCDDLTHRGTLFGVRPIKSSDPPFLDAYRTEIPVKQIIEPVAVVRNGTIFSLCPGWDN